MSRMKDAMRKAGYRSPTSVPHSRKAPEFPASYFETDNQNRSCLKPDFVSKKKVDLLAKFLAHRSRKPNLTTGQIRRFFNHCREIERRLKAEGESWFQVSASFESLCAHAQYAVAANKIPKEFQDFIDENVKKVVSAEEPRKAFLEGFLPHFEALIGFGTTYLRRNR